MLCIIKTQNHVSFIDYHALNYRNSDFEAILRFRFFQCFPQCAMSRDKKPNQLHIDFEIGLRKIALRLRTNQDVGVDFLLQGIVSRQKCYTSTFLRIDLYLSN